MAFSCRPVLGDSSFEVAAENYAAYPALPPFHLPWVVVCPGRGVVQKHWQTPRPVTQSPLFLLTTSSFQPCLLMQFHAYRREKEMRRPLTQQHKCHRNGPERAPFTGRVYQPKTFLARFGGASPHVMVHTVTQTAHLRTVTLSVPTFPLESNARREMVCSPGAS